jgi:hypothetical protein
MQLREVLFMKRVLLLTLLLPLTCLAQSPGVGLTSITAASNVVGNELIFAWQQGSGGSGVNACISGWCPITFTPALLNTYFSGGGGTPANPTAKVGTSAVNGSATTYMRSDAAPPIDLTFSPTWTGTHTFNGTIAGTALSAYLAAPPAIGGTTPAAGAFSSLKDTGISGSTQCLHASTAGIISGTGSDCGSGGSSAFSTLTSGTNTSAAMIVGSGASLAATGSGSIAATSLSGMTAPSTSGVLGYLGLPEPRGVLTGAVTIALTDNSNVLHFNCTSACTQNIPANSGAGSVAFPVGAVLIFDNDCTATTALTVTLSSDTMYLSPLPSVTGTRSVSICGEMFARKETSTTWKVTGTGVT